MASADLWITYILSFFIVLVLAIFQRHLLLTLFDAAVAASIGIDVAWLGLSAHRHDGDGHDRLAEGGRRRDVHRLAHSWHDQRRDGIAAVVLGEPPLGSGHRDGAQRRLRRRIS